MFMDSVLAEKEPVWKGICLRHAGPAASWGLREMSAWSSQLIWCQREGTCSEDIRKARRGQKGWGATPLGPTCVAGHVPGDPIQQAHLQMSQRLIL